MEKKSLESVRNKLLDLSKNNSLLNYKHPKVGSIRVIDELPDQIYEVLSNKKSFSFIPVPEPKEEELLEHGFIKVDPDTGEKTYEEEPSAEKWAKQLGLETSYELPVKSGEIVQQKHKDTFLQTLMYAPSLEACLRSIYRRAETAIQESGTNILYLSLGFLEWYESSDSNVKHLAPLFTLPVTLKRKKFDRLKGAFGYELTLKDDSLLTNITLREKLASFDLVLPEIKEETTPEKYFKRINQTIIKHKPKWKIRRQASLIMLNFRKQVMFQDLNPKNWPKGKELQKHSILKLFFGDSQPEHDKGPNEIQEEHQIDTFKDIHETYPLVFDADSSQHSALIEAVNGKNLVIEGPPGTGKSQTIANLIAAELANGKKILFVAEKMAALEVVKKRLDHVGLGDFCLELHSHKTNKQKIIEDLMYRQQKQFSGSGEIKSKIKKYEELKNTLNNYAEKINSNWRNTESTIHEILNKVTRLRKKLNIDPDSFSFPGISGEEFTNAKSEKLFEQTEILKRIFQKVSEQAVNGQICNHYWYGINDSQVSNYQIEILLRNWTEKLSSLNDFWKIVVSDLEFGISSNAQISDIESICNSVSNLPEIDGTEAFSEIRYVASNVSAIEDFIVAYELIHEKLDDLCQNFKSNSVNQPEVLSKLKQIGEHFSQSGFEPQVKVTDIAQINNEILESFKLANEIEDAFEKIRLNVPKELTDSIIVTKEGLLEFSKIIDLINQLPFDLWQHRNDIYDNSDLDQFLPKLGEALEWIQPLNKKLGEYFSIDSVPAINELKENKAILENSGLLSIFSSEWRKAKKALLSLSPKSKPNIKDMIKLLPDLIKYKEGISEIDKLHQETPLLGDFYNGVNTPIDRCVALRNWYKSVRKQYGMGFEERVSIGNVLLKMNRDTAKSIVDMEKQIIESKRSRLISKISSITESIPNEDSLNDSNSVLSGPESPLSVLNEVFTEHLKYLFQILQNEETSISKINNCIFLMEENQQEIEKIKGGEIYKRFVPDHFSFSLKPGEKEHKSLDSLRNTMAISKIAETSPPVMNSLSANYSSSRYKEIKSTCDELKIRIKNESNERSKFIDEGKVNFDEWSESSENLTDQLILKNETAIENLPWLTTWIEFLKLKKKLSNEGFDQIMESLEKFDIDPNQLSETVEFIVYNKLAKEIMSEDTSISGFSGWLHEVYLEKFKECDRELLKLQCENIAYKASRKDVPAGVSTGKVKDLTELGLIMHEAGKQKKHIAIRELLKRAKKSISALKPCFMMSPMSVSQYLKPGEFEFDLVIMDEASQIRPEDSLGSIARGDKLVVVGDTNQLPPTNFFEKLSAEEEEDDNVALGQTESILESVKPIFANRSLRWHYRSRHESLIAFSNKHFYNSNLVIFPSPHGENDDFGIKFNRVNGSFVSQTNSLEAAEIALKALEYMLEKPNESVGIVSMNLKQKEQIEMELEKLIMDKPQFRIAYERNQELEENLFIKNLENVQGDERDVIMISMTYGPETVGGRTMQRFGPINTDLGWRRLNVLFTRAKKRMHIFSSMNSSDIEVNHSSKKGVKALRAFLEYCETGHLHQNEHTGRAPDSDFEISVMEALKEHGYDCEPQLGVAGYYLDLAVKDPSNPGRFLMGIECDGATYHSAKSTRDRDRLRQEILENLGWEIKRIWSTDWFNNPNAPLQPILNRLQKLKTVVVDNEIEENQYCNKHELIKSLPAPEFVNQNVSLNSNTEEIEYMDVNEVSNNIKSNMEDQSDIQDKLWNALKSFDRDKIKKKFPHTAEEKCLLRPEMMEEIMEHLPESREDFLESIPFNLRQETEGDENRLFLDGVLEIVNDAKDNSLREKCC